MTTEVRANKGAAGVDGQSIARFAAKAEMYLSELSAALKDGTNRPDAVKRVDIVAGFENRSDAERFRVRHSRWEPGA